MSGHRTPREISRLRRRPRSYESLRERIATTDRLPGEQPTTPAEAELAPVQRTGRSEARRGGRATTTAADPEPAPAPYDRRLLLRLGHGSCQSVGPIVTRPWKIRVACLHSPVSLQRQRCTTTPSATVMRRRWTRTFSNGCERTVAPSRERDGPDKWVGEARWRLAPLGARSACQPSAAVRRYRRLASVWLASVFGMRARARSSPDHWPGSRLERAPPLVAPGSVDTAPDLRGAPSNIAGV